MPSGPLRRDASVPQGAIQLLVEGPSSLLAFARSARSSVIIAPVWPLRALVSIRRASSRKAEVRLRRERAAESTWAYRSSVPAMFRTTASMSAPSRREDTHLTIRVDQEGETFG